MPSRGRILIVDDEESVRLLARRVLERAGFSVGEADDGPVAITTFAADPDAWFGVLLDVTLPTLDGLTVLDQMTQIRPSLLVVLTSGWTEEEVSERVGGRHLVRFLQKPYRAESLAEAFS